MRFATLAQGSLITWTVQIGNPAGWYRNGTWWFRGKSSNDLGLRCCEDFINFMFRVSLWPVTIRNSHSVGPWRATDIPVLDLHELAAGKLAALLSRRQARDVFDSHRILGMDDLDSNRLRIGFVAYGAMTRKDWRTISTYRGPAARSPGLD